MSQDTDQEAGTPTSGWTRLKNGLFNRPKSDQWVMAILCAGLGFALVHQVHIVKSDVAFAGARPGDLVQILDSLDQRNQRLDAEITTLQESKTALESGRDARETAAEQRKARANELGILAGTIAAQGPGVVITMTGPVSASLLLDTVQELRDAGAEAISINQVRVVAQTAFESNSKGQIQVGGRVIGAANGTVTIKAIGDSATLASSLQIPGGVVDTAATDSVKVRIAQQKVVVVTAVVPLKSAG